MRIVVVRHGQTAWSITSQHTGRTDIPLTDVGREEALRAAATLTDWDFARSYTSPLQRASVTAEIAGFGHASVDDNLVEWHYGDHEGKRTVDIVVEEPGFSKWTTAPPNGESVDQVGQRVDTFLTRVRDECDPASDVVVFAHGHLLAVFIARWLALPASEGKRFPLETAAVSVLGEYRGNPVLRSLNHQCGHPLHT